MGLVLTAQGLQQGYMLMAQTEWVYSLISMQPYWYVRTFSGISMDIGIALLIITLMRSSRRGRA